MREIVVMSGKGGTGKTAVTASLAVLAGRAVLADADVDAANLELLLDAEALEESPYSGGSAPVKDDGRCDACGLCREHCRFDAIRPDLSIDAFACEACGLCARVCPQDAIAMEPVEDGRLFLSRTPWGLLVHARLAPGGENSGKLVARVRQRARELGAAEGGALLLVDGPPGIGCPAISAITGADRVLLVAEPGVSGLHDLERVLDLADHFRVPAGVVVNRWDLSPEGTRRIADRLEERGIPLIGRIPFDRAVIDAVVAGRPFVLEESPATAALRKLAPEIDDGSRFGT